MEDRVTYGRILFSIGFATACALMTASAEAQTGTPLSITGSSSRRESTRQDETPSDSTPTLIGRLRVFADGNIREALSKSLGVPGGSGTTEADDVAGTARLGLEVVDFAKERSKSGSVSVASTLRKVQDNFVSTVLVPGNAEGLHAMLLEYRGTFRKHDDSADGLRNIFKRHHLYLAIASSDWDSSGTSVNAVTFGAGALRVFPIWQGPRTSPELGISAAIGGSFRAVGGDITLDRHDAFRGQALGTNETTFFGIEGGLQIHIGETTATFQVYRYFPSGEDVPGLTKAQVVALINVRGALYTQDLNGN
jgi:hypothetical protein